MNRVKTRFLGWKARRHVTLRGGGFWLSEGDSAEVGGRIAVLGGSGAGELLVNSGASQSFGM